MEGEIHHHVRPRRRSLVSAVTPPSSSTVEDTKFKEEDYSDDQLLTVPAGWMIKLVAIQVELITSCFLSLIAPFLYLYFQSQAVPSRFAHRVTALLRRLAFGILCAVCAMAILLAVMVVSVLLAVGLARLCVEEPVLLRQPLHFDYTQAHPNATVALRGAWRGGRAVPAGHSVSVSLVLLLPESDHNLRIGVFQVHAEVTSSAGKVMAASSRPCMLRFRSDPVRLMRTFVMGFPLLLGISSESQRVAIEMLGYKETRTRSETVRVKLKPRAGTTELPQLYDAEVVMKSQLPWAKEVARNWKWTFYVWTSLYMYILLLILLVCCFKPFVMPTLRRYGAGRLAEVKKDSTDDHRIERGTSDKRLSDALRSLRQRGKRKALLRPELVEGAASSVAGGEEASAASEVIDDSGDFAASESSECVGG
ncbi:Putative adipose-regulatory protein (Seipin) [Musa troglodytarum]|uniref:Adipose-regulatory protein (Seipin) n=1 Tax=Musa troglodytarum TaxID=320322 RepID=A0A9E7F9J8_9LILI|nr:Putative adipose-regulatory protein (Seipin) [Musa troglodytarum]